MERSNFALRLLPSLLKTEQRIAERENCSVNQLINLALAEKISVLEADYWKERKQAAAQKPRSDVLRRKAGWKGRAQSLFATPFVFPANRKLAGVQIRFS
jgi:hypothetical protein